MKEENDKSKKLQTVERALDVLYLFHKYNGITLSFVAEKMNMSGLPAAVYTGGQRFLKAGKGKQEVLSGREEPAAGLQRDTFPGAGENSLSHYEEAHG